MNMSFIHFNSKLFFVLNIALLIYIILFSKNRRKDSLFLLLGFALSIGCNYRLYGISLGQILMAFVTILCCVSPIKEKQNGQQIGMISKSIILYTLYFCSVTIIGYLSCMDYKVIGSAIQNELRPVMQILQLIALMGTVLYVLHLGKNASISILKVFNYALLVIASRYCSMVYLSYF